MSVWLHFCSIWKINGCSFGFLTTFFVRKGSISGKKSDGSEKMPKNSQKWPVFFYKNNETSSLTFKKLMLFTESHYSAKAPQNMRYNKEQNEFKKTLLFQLYHSFKMLWKMYPFYKFCQFFTIFGCILTLTQKLMCTKEINDLDDSLAWKYIILGVYIANILLKFWVKVFLKIIVR